MLPSMLTTLRIQNLAIVDALEVELRPGLNVVTGETGAGKSILVDALQLILGGRAQAEAVRAGAEEAVVEARFEGVHLDARLEALGLPPADGELVIRRVVARNGRGKVSVNGALSTVATLAQVGRGLIDLSGQHEHVALMDAASHLGLLDAFADLEQDLAEYRQRFERLASARREREALALDEAERARRADYLAFQLRELEGLQPRPGEESELAVERKRLASAERLRTAGASVQELFTGGEGGALGAVARAHARLAEAALLDPGLVPITSGVRAALVELEEASRGLDRYLDALDAQPERLTEVDDRLEALRRLARKHGCTADELPARLEKARAEFDGLSNHEARLAELQAAEERARAAAEESALGLRQKRRRAAERFSKAVRAELSRLGMPQTRFDVGFAEAELGPTGADRAELRIGPNPGEPLKPLAKIASGGELSRVLLAVKRALAAADPVPTYVFDEVDAGIGGAVAEAVGRMLQGVGERRQVLCVTHLPQVAAFADHHLIVRKQVQRGRTVSAVLPLPSPAERQSELARMLAGAAVTAAALEHARLLMEGARRESSGAVRRGESRAARRVRVG